MMKVGSGRKLGGGMRALAAGVSSAPPISCAYPMDATEAQVIGWGFYGKPAMSEGDQKATFAVDMTTESTRYYAAAFADYYDGTATGFSLPSGTSTFQVRFEIPTFTGVGNNNGMIASARLNTPTNAGLIEVNVHCFTNGTHALEIKTADNSGLYYDPAYDNSSGELVLGFEINKEAETIAVRKNGVPLTLSGSTFYYSDAEHCLVAYLEHGNAGLLGAGDSGKSLSIEFITDAANITGTVSSGATDVCGNSI